MMMKPISDPNHISLLLYTRAKVDRLIKTLDSIEETTDVKTQMDVWVYVDEDDTITRDFILSDYCNRYGSNVIFYIGTHTKSLAENYNTLWKESTNAGLYMPAGDDFIIITKGWDRIVRRAFNEYQDRIGFMYAIDNSFNANTIKYPILSAEWINLIGYIFNGAIPFQLEINWLDEISQMIQRKKRLDIFIRPQDNKKEMVYMKNGLFWQHFFVNSIEERVETADILLKTIYSKSASTYKAQKEIIEKFAQEFSRNISSSEIDQSKDWEKNFFVDSGSHISEYVFNHLQMEVSAIDCLVRKLGYFQEKEDIPRILDIFETMILSSMQIKDLQYLRSVYLLKANKPFEAKKAAEIELSIQPNDIKTVQLLEEIQNKIMPESVVEIIKRGMNYFQQENLQMARHEFIRAITLDSAYVSGYVMLGQVEIVSGRSREAETALLKALSLDSHNYQALFGLGKVLYDTHRYMEARSYLQAAAREDPRDKEVWVGLAMIEKKLQENRK